MALWDVIQNLLGLQASTLTFGHMTCRALVVYAKLLLLLRLIGDRRFSGQHAAIDVVLSIILGATLSRSINGTTPFSPTLGEHRNQGIFIGGEFLASVYGSGQAAVAELNFVLNTAFAAEVKVDFGGGNIHMAFPQGG